MKLFSSVRPRERKVEEAVGLSCSDDCAVLRNIGWVSAGITMLAIGVVVGRELRQRYKFNHRTPYDFYAHAGDELQDMEFI